MTVQVTRDTHSRSVAKALSWRLLGTLVTAGLVLGFTRQWSLSLIVGGLEFVSKIGLFWVHERFWDGFTFGKRGVRPSVVWFTGLSGSGKSTIAEALASTMKTRGLPVEHLDGDGVRKLFPATGFSRSERAEHLRRVGFLASRLESHGVFVVAAFVSPFADVRQAVRGMCGSFIEVHVDTPLEVCESRDVKGLYAKARQGDIANFTGVSAPYEPPTSAEIVIDTTRTTVDEAVEEILVLVVERMKKGRDT